MNIIPRDYQIKACENAITELKNRESTLILSATGTGKTIMFAIICETLISLGWRILILADSTELLTQARDKITKTTGLPTALEKADITALTNDQKHRRIVVGSVQTLSRMSKELGYCKRLNAFPKDYFNLIICDEAHKSKAKSYDTIYDHFDKAKKLGVTATNFRLDGKKLEDTYESIAFEMTLPQAILNGWLVPPRAKMISLKDCDISQVKKTKTGLDDVGFASALDEYLPIIAEKLKEHCADRKTVIYTPLISTSQKMQRIFQELGLNALEVNGESKDRNEILVQFNEAPKGTILLNSMLLTTGWDEEQVDCIVPLRKTNSWSLMVQMLGRATRPILDQIKFNNPNMTAEDRRKMIAESVKPDFLIIDFLFEIGNLNLCKAPSIFTDDNDHVEAMQNELDAAADGSESIDLMELMDDTESDAVQIREDRLAEILKEQEAKRSKMLNPMDLLASSMLENDNNSDYKPEIGWKSEAVTEHQAKVLDAYNINSTPIPNAYEAERAIQLVKSREEKGLSTLKAINKLTNAGFKDVDKWTHQQARKTLSILAQNFWKYPANRFGMPARPEDYRPR